MHKKTKLWLLIAAGLILLGGLIFTGVMTALHWDFTKLSTTQYETKTYEIQEAFTGINLNTQTADIVILPSPDNNAKVVCHDEASTQYNVTVKENTLQVNRQDTKKWYQHIGISFENTKVTVYLPKSVCADVSVTVSTGDISLQDITAKSITMQVATGDITLKNVVAADILQIKSSTGDVVFDQCDGGQIHVQTDTGDVTGTLLTPKTFITHTDTGNVTVPQSTTGGKCEITTETGDITIR